MPEQSSDFIQDVKDRMLIEVTSGSLKYAKARYSTIRSEVIGLKFALANFRNFLIVLHFIVRVHQFPMNSFIKKVILSIENGKRRDLVASLSQ